MTDHLDPFVDDREGIPDDTLLYRRINWNYVGGMDRYPPGETPELSGNCFRDYPEDKARDLGYAGRCMSVGVGTIIQSKGLLPEVMLEGYEGYGLAVVRAGDLRTLHRFNGTACPQGVMPRPTPSEPWHAVVFDTLGPRRPDAVCEAIADVAEWHVPLVRTSPSPPPPSE